MADGVVPSAAGEASVWIQVLGRVTASGPRGSVALGGDGRTHVRSLIASIAALRQGIPKEELAEALWPRQTDRGARNRLYHTMHLARQLIGGIAWPDDWVTIDGGRVCLDSRVDGDALRIGRALAARVEALPDIELMQYLDWLREEWAPGIDAAGIGHSIRQTLQSGHVLLLREATRRHAAAGDTPQRRESLERLIALEPADEQPQRELMQLDLDAGRWHQVLRRYDGARRALVHNLGMRPSRALSDLAAHAAARLCDDTPAADAPAWVGEPSALLLGRESMLRDLSEQLAGGCGLWNIHGMGGVGKSSVALEAARRAAPRIDADVVRLSLDAGDTLDVARQILNAVGVDPEAGTAADELLQAWLAMHPTILIIDPLAPLHFAEALDALARIVATGSSARVLLVSNAPVPGERASWRSVPVGTLEVPAPGTHAAQVRHFPSVALFCRRCAAAGIEPGVDFSWDEIADLVRRLDGLPLAIELAAAACVTMTPAEILQYLDGDDASSGDQAGLVREPLERSLDLSFRLLDDAGRRTLMACAVFEGPFSAEEAKVHVGTCVAAIPADVGRLLQQLESAGLAVAATGNRWRILNLVRDHARTHARQLGLWQRIEEARVDRLAHLLSANAVSTEAPGYTAWMSEVADLHDEAVAMLPVAMHWRDERVLRLLVPLAHLWSQRCQSSLGLPWCDAGIAIAAAASDTPCQVELMTLAASLCIDSLRVQEALTRASQAVALAADLDFGAVPAQAVFVLSRAMVVARPAREAIALIRSWWARQGVQARECEGQPTLLAAWLNIQFATKAPIDGNAAPPVVDFSRLRARLDGSLVWRNLLKAMCAPRSPIGVEQRLELADELRRLSGGAQAHRMALTALNFKVQALLELDRLDEATLALQQQSTIADQIGRHSSVVVAQLSLAQIGWYQGSVQEAHRQLDDAARFLERHRSADLDAAMRLHRVIVACLEGRGADATAGFLSLERSVFVRCRLTLLHHAATAGALLAQSLGHDDLADALSKSLGRLLPDDLLPPVARRFRRLAFKNWPPELPTDGDKRAVDDETEFGQAALCTLYDTLVADGRPPFPGEAGRGAPP